MQKEFYVQLEVTSRCNLRCKHCYIDEYSKDIHLNDYMEFMRKLEHFAKAIGVNLNIAITGGEPLCHPDINTILKDLKQRQSVNQIVLFYQKHFSCLNKFISGI